MLIILDKVNYVYSEGSGFEKKALDDVSLTIDKGGIYRAYRSHRLRQIYVDTAP